MTNNNTPPIGEILLYQTEDGQTRLQVMLEQETLWLNQKQLTELFGKSIVMQLVSVYIFLTRHFK